MANKLHPPTKSSPKPPFFNDGDGNHIPNKTPLGLPNEFAMLFPKLEFVRLNVHQVLH